MTRHSRFVMGGRCQSGTRWFWFAGLITDEDEERCDDPVCGGFLHPHEYGWAGTEAEALEALHAAVARLNPDPPDLVTQRASTAAKALKRINAARRAARPPSGETKGAPTEYLWGLRFYKTPVSFRVTRKTAKRIYYVRREARWGDDGPETGYVSREAMERDGKVWSWSKDYDDDATLFATREAAEESIAEWLRQDQAGLPDLKELRRAMADAHPDRGGSADEFMAARQRYRHALRLATGQD